MKALGIHVDEAAVAQLAMQQTGKDLPEQLDATELAAARYTSSWGCSSRNWTP